MAAAIDSRAGRGSRSLAGGSDTGVAPRRLSVHRKESGSPGAAASAIAARCGPSLDGAAAGLPKGDPGEGRRWSP